MGVSTSSRIVRTLVAVSASVAIIAGLFAGVFAARWYTLRNVSVDRDFERVDGGKTQPSAPNDSCSQPCNILLLGSDSRTGLSASQQGSFGSTKDIGGDARADTIMLVHLDPDTSKTVVLSFPRDLWVKIPGRGMDKINAAFEGGAEHGGPELMAKTVFALTHIPIDHYLYVDLNGFQQALDKLGGVNMCIPPYYVNTPGDLEATDPSGNIITIHYNEAGHVVDPYTGLDILPGCHHLDGTQALAYVRARHNLPCSPIGDFARIGRQQQFMRALINQMLMPSEIVKAPGLVGPVLSSLRRDSRLSPADLVYLIGQMRGVSTGAVQFRSISGTDEMIGYQDAVRMDPAAEKLFEAIRVGAPVPEFGSTLPLTPPSPANVTVAVIDVGGNDSASNEVEGTLSEAGFDVGPGIVHGSFPEGINKAAIVYAPMKEAYAQVVHSYFPGLPMIEVKNLDTPVAVVVPRTYQAPASSPPDGQSSASPVGAPCPSPTA